MALIGGERAWSAVRRLGSLALIMVVLFSSVTLPARVASAQSQSRFVFAHYMVCCPRGAMDAEGAYRAPTVDDFLEDIQEAHDAGVDGFALNCGEWNGAPRYKANSAMLFAAALRFGPEFKLFFSADGVTPDEAADMVATYGHHPNQLRYEGRPVLSSFGGDNKWVVAIRNKVEMRSAEGVFFMPFIYPKIKRQVLTAGDVQSVIDDNPDIDGYFYFGAGGTPDDLAKEIRLNAERWPGLGKIFMAGVSPYYRGLRNNFIIFESKGFESLVKQWMMVIETNTQWVELVTWNDWSEDTYFSSLSPTGAGSRWMNIWGDMLSHDGFREINRYFIDWFKSGSQPRIEQERVFYTYRLHRSYMRGHPYPGTPQTAHPRWSGDLVDRVYAVSLLRQPAELVVQIGAQSEHVSLSSGLSLASVRMHSGAVKFELRREGVAIGSKSGDYPISATGSWGNFNTLAGAVEVDGSKIPGAPN